MWQTDSHRDNVPSEIGMPHRHITLIVVNKPREIKISSHLSAIRLAENVRRANRLIEAARKPHSQRLGTCRGARTVIRAVRNEVAVLEIEAVAGEGEGRRRVGRGVDALAVALVVFVDGLRQRGELEHIEELRGAAGVGAA